MNRKLNLLHSGLTIIEVMTSIVVAMIGVMGVMILVPFAVRQAQTGLDIEAAAVVARNAYSLLEIGGYRNHENWLVYHPDTPFPGITPIRKFDPLNPSALGLPVAPDALAPAVQGPYFPQPFSIDPLGVTENGDYVDTSFPFNLDQPSLLLYPNIYKLPAANLNLPIDGIVGFSKADARRMFQARDDLVFGEAQNSLGQTDAQLNGPSQAFDQASGIDVRRQAVGRFSWSAIAVPNKLAATGVANVSNWKLFMLVYKDRVLDVSATDTNPINYSFSPKMRAAALANPPPVGTVSPMSTIRIDGSIPSGAIKKDEWVMLINRQVPDPATYPVGHGYDWQIAFYRVVNYSSGTPSILTLDGPDFTFDDPAVLPRYQDTYCVHLKNVVSVFERTIAPEGNSIWNLAF